jgi:DNA polymerase-3 subunit beta
MTMKITIARNTLLPALARAATVADRKATLPVTECVLLSADATGLRVASSDLYHSVSQTVDCEVKAPGACAVPASELLRRIKAMPAGAITIALNDKQSITITAKGTKRKFTMHALPATDFPSIPEMPGTADVMETLTTETLALLIKQVIFAVSTDETRAHLNGALFQFGEDGTLRIVGTDGHRMSIVEAQVSAEKKSDTVVPLKALQAWQKVLNNKDAPTTVTFAKDGSTAFLRVAGVDFSAKLTDAQFPPYAAVVPEKCETLAVVDRAALAGAIKAVSLAASSRTNGVHVTLNGALVVQAESGEAGNARDELNVDYGGAEQRFGLNADYFVQALDAFECDEVALSVTGELDPILVVPAKVSSGDRSYVRQICMPMRA